MTDPQMVTIGLATIVLFAGILFNNARISDVQTRLTDLKEVFRAELRAERSETNGRFDRLEAKIDALLKLQADMDARLNKLEQG